MNIARLSPHPNTQLRTATPLSQTSKTVYNTPTTFRRHGDNNESYEDNGDIESGDFDDLIFALKSGPSVNEEINEDRDDHDLPPTSSASEQYAIRRIKMGDTHL